MFIVYELWRLCYYITGYQLNIDLNAVNISRSNKSDGSMPQPIPRVIP